MPQLSPPERTHEVMRPGAARDLRSAAGQEVGIDNASSPVRQNIGKVAIPLTACAKSLYVYGVYGFGQLEW